MLDRQFFQCGHDEVVGFPEGEAVGEVDGVEIGRASCRERV